MSDKQDCFEQEKKKTSNLKCLETLTFKSFFSGYGIFPFFSPYSFTFSSIVLHSKNSVSYLPVWSTGITKLSFSQQLGNNS